MLPPSAGRSHRLLLLGDLWRLVMSTQFWDTYTGFESEGQVLPKDTWSLHGLWPDFCDGSFTQYCDLERQYDRLPSPNTTDGKPDGTPVPAWTGPNIGTFLEPFGKYDLLAYMKKYWSLKASRAVTSGVMSFPSTLHATRPLTSHAMDPSTASTKKSSTSSRQPWRTTRSYQPGVGSLRAKIWPSNSTTYSLIDLQAALKKGFGAVPYIGCSGPRYIPLKLGRDLSITASPSSVKFGTTTTFMGVYNNASPTCGGIN